MDGFTYYDIFQTKGIEYLIIIAFLLLLIPFWFFVNQQKTSALRFQNSLGVLTHAILNIPKGILYCKNHTWAHIEKSGLANIGIDDWLLHLIGNAKFSNLKKPGDNIKKGDLMTEIEINGKVLRVFSPITGKVFSANLVETNVSQTLAIDPYSEGWLYKLEPTNWRAEISNFYFGEEARNWFKQELLRFKDFVAVSLGQNSPLTSMLVLQEGGELRDHALCELSAAVWQDFQKEFLDS
ncbi:MAG: hypothetical protein PF517_17055 [Salinivirgaceae bacterium]|jgi:glycine cleavage system H protein|nr:hypothetical protein [Salinivirgaceae bacterium]